MAAPPADAPWPDGPPGYPSVRAVGLSGVLVSFSDVLTDAANHAALAFRDRIEAERIAGVTETSTALTSAFVSYDPLALPLAELSARIKALLATGSGPAPDAQPQRLWHIPTAFGGADGPQLAEAAGMAGLTPEAAVAAIAATPLRVMAIGFAPGQPYIGSLPERWNLPRQTSLTTEVPAGSVAVAVRQLVLFANASPTGWRVIGRTGFRVFQPEAKAPFALRPGDGVRLLPVSADELADIIAGPDGSNGGARCEWRA